MIIDREGRRIKRTGRLDAGSTTSIIGETTRRYCELANARHIVMDFGRVASLSALQLSQSLFFFQTLRQGFRLALQLRKVKFMAKSSEMGCGKLRWRQEKNNPSRKVQALTDFSNSIPAVLVD